MLRDDYGLPISTRSKTAAARYREATDCLLSAWPGAADLLDAAIEADPNFALAHAARARVHAMHAAPSEAHKQIGLASEAATSAIERERSHIEVVALALGGRSREALARALAHADAWPRDVTILSMLLGAFGLLAFSGMPDHDQARVDLCERLRSHFGSEDWWFIDFHGWALVENHDVSRGRGMLEHAFALRRNNANAVHGLAHAMFESGALAESEALIADWLPSYDRTGIMHGHISWHAALAALERDDAETALAIYTEQVNPAVSHAMPINAVTDAASLLWRLDAYGYGAPPGLWRDVAAFAQRQFPKPGHAFVDAHMALIESATDNRAGLDRRIADLDSLVATGALGAGSVVPTIARAALSFADGGFAECVQVLSPLASEVVRIGGSGAQRSLFEDMLLVALMRSGDVSGARALLDLRLHRRPSRRDRQWRSDLAA